MEGSEYTSSYNTTTTQSSSLAMHCLVGTGNSTCHQKPSLEAATRYSQRDDTGSCHYILTAPLLSGGHDLTSIEVTVLDCNDGDESVEITVSPAILLASPSRAGPSSAHSNAHCFLCNEVFPGKAGLKEHLVTAHQEGSTKTSPVGQKRKRCNAGTSASNYLLHHPSVCSDVPSLMNRLQLPRCRLCRFSPRYVWLESLRLHFNMSHVQRAVQLQDGTYLLRCRLFCDRRTHCHYHCPNCDFLSPRIKRIKVHAAACAHVSTLTPSAITVPRDDAKSTYECTENNTVKSEVLGEVCYGKSKELISDLHRNKMKHKAAQAKPSTHKSLSSTIPNSLSVKKEYRDTSSFDVLSHDMRLASASDISDTESTDQCPRNIAIHATDDASESGYMSVTIVKSEAVEGLSSSDEDLSIFESVWLKVKDELLVKNEKEPSEGDLCIHEIGEPRALDDKQLSSLPCFAPCLQEAFDRLSCGSCYLCLQAPQFDSPLALELHFYRSHVRHSVLGLDDRLVLVCGLGCDGCPGLHVHCTRCRHQEQDVQTLLHHCQHRHHLHPAPTHHGKDIRHINTHCHAVLAELLMLEPDAEQFPFMAPEFSADAQLTVITDAYQLYCRIQPPRCVLCEDGHEYKTVTKLHTHFQRSHIKRANSSCPVPSLVCRLSCRGYGRGHYHCPFCSYTMHDVNKLRVHQHEAHRALLKRAELNKARGITITADDDGVDREHELEECQKTCEGGFIKGKKKIRESTSLTKATSVVSSFDEIRDKIRLPDCLLCRGTRNFVTEKRLKNHLEKTHIKQAIKATESLYVLNCRLYSNKYKNRGHFHCPWCLFQSHDRTIFTNHINNHTKKMELSRQQTKALMMARLLNPDFLGQYRVDPQQVPVQLRSQIQSWQLRYNRYLKTDFSQSLKRNSCVMAHRRRKAIIDYLLFGAALEPYLAGYVTFKNYTVMNAPELGMENCLVEPVVRYKRHEQGTDASVDRSFRKVACVEEFFKVLYELHVLPSGEHNTLHELHSLVRSQYVFLPSVVVPIFMQLCPICKSLTNSKVRLQKSSRSRLASGQAVMPGASDQPPLLFARDYPALPSARGLEAITSGTVTLKSVLIDSDAAASDGGPLVEERSSGEGGGPCGVGRLSPDASLEAPLSNFMTVLQVNLVDMSEHPDGEYSYVVHCQDRHSQLHFLFPLAKLDPVAIARGVSCRVLANTGLPRLILSNYGKEFVQTLLSHIKNTWTTECDELAQRCLEASDEGGAGLTYQGSDLVTRELSSRVMCCQREGRDTTWAAWLPHLQYTLNTRSQRPDPCPYQLAFHRLPQQPAILSLSERSSIN